MEYVTPSLLCPLQRGSGKPKPINSQDVWWGGSNMAVSNKHERKAWNSDPNAYEHTLTPGCLVTHWPKWFK